MDIVRVIFKLFFPLMVYIGLTVVSYGQSNASNGMQNINMPRMTNQAIQYPQYGINNRQVRQERVGVKVTPVNDALMYPSCCTGMVQPQYTRFTFHIDENEYNCEKDYFIASTDTQTHVIITEIRYEVDGNGNKREINRKTMDYTELKRCLYNTCLFALVIPACIYRCTKSILCLIPPCISSKKDKIDKIINDCCNVNRSDACCGTGIPVCIVCLVCMC